MPPKRLNKFLLYIYRYIVVSLLRDHSVINGLKREVIFHQGGFYV